MLFRSLDNLQTLCNECNRAKERQEINYNIHISPLTKPKELILFKASKTEKPKNVLKRIVNNMYHCGAVCQVKYHVRKNGEFYDKWLIKLFEGNNIKWLEDEKGQLLKYIQVDLGNEHVKDIIIK